MTRWSGSSLADLLQRVDAIQSLHLDVEQDQVEGLGTVCRDRLAARCRSLHVVPSVAEHLTEHVANRALVIHYENAPLHRIAPCR